MIEHVVSSLGYGLISFEGGASVAIDPPPDLDVGTVVQIELHGISRVGITWMKWTAKDGKEHFIRYNIDGYPIK
jgi:hypothetical protein